MFPVFYHQQFSDARIKRIIRHHASPRKCLRLAHAANKQIDGLRKQLAELGAQKKASLHHLKRVRSLKKKLECAATNREAVFPRLTSACTCY